MINETIKLLLRNHKRSPIRLNEGLRRRMNNPKGAIGCINLQQLNHTCSTVNPKLTNPTGLKKGLVQQWNAATSPMEKLRPQMRWGHRLCMFTYCIIGCDIWAARFAFLKAFLLDKEMGSIQVDAYYEESFACIWFAGCFYICISSRHAGLNIVLCSDQDERVERQREIHRVAAVWDYGKMGQAAWWGAVCEGHPSQLESQNFGCTLDRNAMFFWFTRGQTGKKHPQTSDANWRIYRVFKEMEISSILVAYIII